MAKWICEMTIQFEAEEAGERATEAMDFFLDRVRNTQELEGVEIADLNLRRVSAPPRTTG